MIKKRLAAVAVALMLGGLLLAPAQRASAHEVFTGFLAPFHGGVFFTHFGHVPTFQTKSAMTFVGFDQADFNIGTTQTISMASGTYRIRAQDRCTNGRTFDTGWVTVSQANFAVRTSGCKNSGFVLSRGQGGIFPF